MSTVEMGPPAAPVTPKTPGAAPSGCVFILSTTSQCLVTSDKELKIPKIILGDKSTPSRSYLVTIKPPNYVMPKLVNIDNKKDNVIATKNSETPVEIISNEIVPDSPEHDYEPDIDQDDYGSENIEPTPTKTPAIISTPVTSVPETPTSTTKVTERIANIKSLLERNEKINKGETAEKRKMTKSKKKKEESPKKMKCKQCDFTSDSKEECIKHSLEVHQYKDPENNYQCQYCDYSTFHIKYLKRHRSLKHPFTKPNTCHLCDFSCVQKGLLTRHLILQHNYSLMSCKKCDFKCDSLMSLIEHRKTHSLAPQQCQYCDHESANATGLKVHMKKKHPEAADDNYVYDDLPENTNGYNCKHCNENFMEKDQLREHMKTRHEIDNVLFCKYCSYTTAKKGTFYLHVQTKHSQVKPYICKICDFQTRSKQSFLLHNRSVHLKLKPYRCNGHGCSFKGATKTHLTRHIAAIHINYKPNTCEYCPYSTAQRSNLQQHMLKVHSVHLEPSTRGGFLHKDKVLEELVNKFQEENGPRPPTPAPPPPQPPQQQMQHTMQQQTVPITQSIMNLPPTHMPTNIMNQHISSNDRYLQL